MRKLSFPFLALAVASCTVGPNYIGPPNSPPDATPGTKFVRAPASASPDEPALAQWWISLGDPVLNSLEARALAGNPGLAAALARIAQARQNVRFERAEQFPTGAAQGTYVHADLPGLNLDTAASAGESGAQKLDGTSIDFFNLGLNANWEIDLWGGQRRTAEAANAQLGAAVANGADAQVQLTAEVAQAYVNLRERQHRLSSLRRDRVLRQQQLRLAEQRFQRGTTAVFVVERVRTQLNGTETDIAAVEAERDSYLNAIAALTGTTPGVLDPLLAPMSAIPLPPASVAIGNPASLIARRPDIRAAERNLAAASARIGVVEAARLPNIGFLGILGIGGTSADELFDHDNMSKIAIPQIQWGILDFGRSLARLRQTRSGRDEALAQYQQVVLGALQDVETALARFGHQRENVAALAKISASAERSSLLMRQRYDAGVTTLGDALEAERQSHEAERNFRAGTAALTGSFVAVQKSLGLGWQQPTDVRLR